MATVLFESLSAWWPEVILSLGALLTILIGVIRPRKRALTLACAACALILAAMALLQTVVPARAAVFFGLIACDALSTPFRWMVLLAVFFTVLVAASSTRERAIARHGEYLGLVLFIGVGLMLMAEAQQLLMAYLAMELVSLSSYLLVGFLNDQRACEAALKYLLYGALSSGIMLFGMSILFGLAGSLSFPEITQALTSLPGAFRPALILSIILMLAGLAFKISMVPFHMWTPDAYEGAPIPVAGLLSVGPKAAGLALLIRLLAVFAPAWASLAPVFLWLTVITMTLGNLVALVQTNIKRLLAYSTIAQVGYLLIGLVVHTGVGRQALVIYLLAYLFMNLGAFACAAAVFNDTGSESLEAFRGLAQRAPGLALMFALFLLSLAGIPPLVGFFGKFLLFKSALEAGFLWLAVAGVVNSAVALYYYVNVIRWMYLQSPQETKPLKAAPLIAATVWVCALATLVLGLFPAPLLGLLGRILPPNLI